MLAGNEELDSNFAAVIYLEVLERELIRLRAEFPSQWALLEQESWREELTAAVTGI
jgi:hypothetical protein